MDEQSNRPINPRRRRRTQMEIFKEVYLPALIAIIAVLMILVYIIGSISRAIKKNKAAYHESMQASIAAEQQLENWSIEADSRVAEAEALAAECDYDGALDVLNAFSGEMSNFPILYEKISAYEQAKSELVLWDDPNDVVNLSFQMLVADPSRAFTDTGYGRSYNKNYITTEEFSKILQQLYNNGYMLISMDDIVEEQISDTGEVTYAAKPLYLPSGKKPLMITQAQVNYYIYMTDGPDDDELPDKEGAGFGSKLILDENGNITCQMVDKDGNTIAGDYDLVPILEKFIENNPGFSYRGARATLSVSGCEGIFGYRTNTGSEDEIYGAQQVINALRQKGYDIACYTYENAPYGQMDANAIRADLSAWTSEVVPILDDVDTFVFALDSDISENPVYTGEKYEILRDAGFRYYIGFSNNGKCWATITPEYVHMGRLLVTGSNIAYHADWYEGMFDTTSLLDPSRGEIPQY